MLTHSHQVILPIERWNYIRGLGKSSIKNEAHYRSLEMATEIMKKNYPERYSEDWYRNEKKTRKFHFQNNI